MFRRPLLPLLALAALLALPPACHAINCYSCSDLSFEDMKKADHPVAKIVTEHRCSDFDSDNSTFKIESCVGPWTSSCISLNYANGRLVRGCYNLAHNNCTVSDQLTECVCTTDYCNAAGLTTPALLLLLLPAALMAAFYSA